jgi:hypothetical protein
VAEVSSESELHPDIVSSPLIEVIPLAPTLSVLRSSSKLFFPIIAPLKALSQAWNLYHALGYRSEPARYMLVQVSCVAFVDLYGIDRNRIHRRYQLSPLLLSYAF